MDIYLRLKSKNRILWRRATGIVRTILGQGRFHEDFSISNFLMTFVEVEVDTTTGKIKLVNVVTAPDAVR